MCILPREPKQQRHCAATDWSVSRGTLSRLSRHVAPDRLALATSTRALTATPSTGAQTERDLPK